MRHTQPRLEASATRGLELGCPTSLGSKSSAMNLSAEAGILTLVRATTVSDEAEQANRITDSTTVGQRDP